MKKLIILIIALHAILGASTVLAGFGADGNIILIEGDNVAEKRHRKICRLRISSPGTTDSHHRLCPCQPCNDRINPPR